MLLSIVTVHIIVKGLLVPVRHGKSAVSLAPMRKSNSLTANNRDHRRPNKAAMALLSR